MGLVVIAGIGMEAAIVTCAPVTCAAPRTTWAFAGKPDTVWAAPATPADQVVSFEPGLARIGEQMLMLDGTAVAPWSGAVAGTGSGVYATAAEATPRPGLHVTIGEPAERAQPDYWRQVLWRCDQARCRRQILDEFEAAAGREMLAVGADGRILLVRPDRILLISA